MSVNNYKLAFIHQKENPFKKAIQFYGEVFLNIKHSNHILQYLKNNFPNERIIEDLEYDQTDVLGGYYLTTLGIATFFNTTLRTKSKTKSGFIMLPKKISTFQKEALINFLNILDEYEVILMYNLSFKNNILDGDDITIPKNISKIEQFLEITEKRSLIKRLIKK